MPISDRLVSPVQQGIVRYLVLIDILLDLLEGPVGERVDLDQTSIIDLDDRKIASLSTLTPSTSGQHSLDTQLGIGPLSGLNLGYKVVEVVVGFPELLAVLGDKVGGG